jgi:isoleucyl-tRNA synthetase
VNVKRVRTESAIDAFASFQLAVNARVLGPRLGQEMKTVLAAAKAGQWERAADGSVSVAGHRLSGDEFSLRLVPKPGVACQALGSGELIVVLDFALTKELEQEGVARDLVRAIQQARRDAGLAVSDRIRLSLGLEPTQREAARAFASYIAENVLATTLDLDGALGTDGMHVSEAKLDEGAARIALAKA